MTSYYPSHDRDVDIAIIGAGFAGSMVAIKAADLGLNVRVFDPHPEYPNRFRAEKLETDQYDGLERLGLVHLVQPRLSPFIDQVTVFHGRRRRIVPCKNHRGMDYQSTVNSFRQELKKNIPIIANKIERLTDDVDHCGIHLKDGSLCRARLAVVATGGSQQVRKSLGLRAPAASTLRSTTFGFFVDPAENAKFSIGAFNVVPLEFVEGLQFATFFPIGRRMRVNIFTCWHPSSDEARLLRSSPISELYRYFPDLPLFVGGFRLASQPEVFTTNYYRQDCRALSSAVLIGDDYQSVSPATGMGISKCVTDVQTLVGLLARQRKSRWRLDLNTFYNHPDKRRVDQEAQRRWASMNERSSSRSLRGQLRRFKLSLASTVGDFLSSHA